MKTTDYNKIAIKLSPMLNALSHPARLQIMLHLAKYNGCQAGSISARLPLAKSTVSEHLSKLREVGLIICDADGKCLNYRISDDGFKMLNEVFKEFLTSIEQEQAKPRTCSSVHLNSKKTLAKI